MKQIISAQCMAQSPVPDSRLIRANPKAALRGQRMLELPPLARRAAALYRP